MAIGRYRDQLLLSTRTYDAKAHAGTLVRGAIGGRGTAGGHGTLAGGQVPVKQMTDDQVEALRDEILADLLEELGVTGTEPQRLVPDELEGE